MTTATDYADIGLPRYLEFDGVDDAMSTASVDFTGTDEMTVCAGVYKQTAASGGVIVELGVSTAAINSFGLAVGPYVNSEDGFVSRANVYQFVTSGSNTAPRLDVWTGTADISQPILALRANGIETDSNTSSQGTGNYRNSPLNIGARNNGADLKLNGRIHQLIVRGKSPVGNLIRRIEEYVANKTGVSL